MACGRVDHHTRRREGERQNNATLHACRFQVLGSRGQAKERDQSWYEVLLWLLVLLLFNLPLLLSSPLLLDLQMLLKKQQSWAHFAVFELEISAPRYPFDHFATYDGCPVGNHPLNSSSAVRFKYTCEVD